MFEIQIESEKERLVQSSNKGAEVESSRKSAINFD